MQAPRLLGLFTSCAFLLAATPTAPRQRDPATTDRLGGPHRLLTYVSTDKPIYKEQETIYIRGVVLDATSHAPTASSPNAQLTIKGPKGETVMSGQAPLQDGAFGFSWTLPQGQAGGEYTVVASGSWGQAPGERKFDVRAYRAPRLKSQITFARDGFGPGDVVVATLETSRAEGGVPTQAKVTAVARVDGADVARSPCTLDAAGRCTVSLRLPQAIERGEGVLAFTIEDGGVVETATKSIPILVTAFDIAVYPEGGELVAGLPGRVYLEARTPAKKPADIAGVVVDSGGKEVASFRTEHEGRGRFELLPQKGQRYTLRVTEPASVKKTLSLPAVVEEGATLRARADVVPASEPVRLTVAWTGDRMAKVVLQQREVTLDAVTLDAGKQRGSSVALDAKDASGVLVATVYAKDGTPLAERLVFREPKQQLTIELEPDRERYVPGAPVALKVRTLVDGKPTSAVVGLTVTDDSVEELIEKREQAPALPLMVLLEADVRELFDAHVYLDPKNRKAPLAVDLLLATQGWRRFALVDVATFLSRERDAARRALALVDQPTPPSPAARGGLELGEIPAAGVAPRPARLPPAEEKRARAPVEAAAPPPPPPSPAAAPAKVVMAKEALAADELAPRRARAHMGPWAESERAARVPLVTVREYAHLVRPDRRPNDRLDFAETLYWAAGVKTDANGEATVRFGTSDAVTSFRASAGGYTGSGVLGARVTTLESVKPFYVEPKLPLEVTEGDVVRLPIAFVNGTREPLSGVSLSLKAKGDLRFTAPSPFGLAADQRARRVVEIAIGPKSRSTELALEASAGGYLDQVTRAMSIKPRGFPAVQTAGGLLEASGKAEFKLVMPADTVPGSVESSISVYPSPAGNLSAALKNMIREPSGCFEQTSSTTYPMTMALQYFLTHTGAEPSLVQDAKEKLDRGYKRLVGFECKNKGYEWFGEDPAHEALTAYGLLQFSDMQRVRQVDTSMVANTRAWLLKQRDGKGGFERKRRALHVWVEDKDASDAYITWALLEAGEKALGQEVKHVKTAGLASSNSYVVALAANVALKSGDVPTARTLLTRLAGKQGPDGLVTGGTQSIVGSTGRSLAIETTALATLGWLKQPDPSFTGNIERAMKGLAEASSDGGYGATQSTVLALRAVLEYDRQRNAERKPGAVRVYVDGKPVGGPSRYDATAHAALSLFDVSELLGPGAHTVELRQEAGARLPWTIAIRSSRTKPESSLNAKVGLEVKLPPGALTEGAVVEATARVTNLTDTQLPTVVAIVGLPGGLEPRVDHLKELVKQKTIDAYEVLGRDVVLYWRGMTPKSQVRVPVSLVAAVPGRYVGPASRAYLYYGSEDKAWVEGLNADISAKN